MPSLVAFRQNLVKQLEIAYMTERQTDRQYKEQQCVSGCTDEWQQSMIKGNNAYVQYAKQYQCRLKSNWEDASDDGWDDERKHRRASSDRDCRSQRYEHRRPDHSRHTAVYLCYTHTHTHTWNHSDPLSDQTLDSMPWPCHTSEEPTPTCQGFSVSHSLQ